MKDAKNSENEAKKLRYQAEELLKEKGAIHVEQILNESPEKIEHLLHELSVHQIELELQNEELQSTQEELETAKQSYVDLYEYAPVGYMTLSDHGVILEANLTATAMLGVPRASLLNQYFTQFIYFDDQDRYYLMHERLVKSLDHQTCELRMLKESDGLFWAQLDGVSIGKDAFPFSRIIISDITERIRHEQEKEDMATRLSQQQRLESIGILASGVAHEINNPINGIMNYGQLILDSAKAGSDNAEFAKAIVYESVRVATIVGNLLQFSRNNNQEHSNARIKDIIDQTFSLIKTIIKHDQIDLQLDIPKDLPLIKCRSQQIQQVIMNLLTNARDALNEKYEGYHEDKIIRVACQQFKKDNRRWLRVTVEDHGTGIPEAIQEKIFELFFTSKRRDMGTGLGLSISNQIVQEHHGALSFETKEGSYTKFYLDLPIDNGWEL